MSWCSTSRGGPTPARVTRTATPAIGMVSETQLPAIVLTLLWLLPSFGLVTANDVGPEYPLPAGAGKEEAATRRRWSMGSGADRDGGLPAVRPLDEAAGGAHGDLRRGVVAGEARRQGRDLERLGRPPLPIAAGRPDCRVQSTQAHALG